MMNATNIYFIGAGGIGMSALVRYYLAKGLAVAGYDRVESALTRELVNEGAMIHYHDNVDLIPISFKDKESTLVVYTPAVPADHEELTYFRNRGFTIVKRAQLLGEITRSTRAICVAGTHGKTTVSSMIAHLLWQSTIGCNAFLGGILKNYGNNLLLAPHSELTVVEADEYDRSFHWLTPYMAVITSVSPDHLDIYGSEEAYREAFVRFASLVRPGGVLLMEKSVDLDIKRDDISIYRYGIKGDSHIDFCADNIRIEDGEIRFDFISPSSEIKDIVLGVPIEINIPNATAALAIGKLCGLTDEELRCGTESYPGTKRRFDFRIKNDRHVLIDDYAHHPEELEASIRSVKRLYPHRRITVVFQPHLYSRTRDFYLGFAEALSLADSVILLPIYPAREEPIPGVSSEMIGHEITINDKRLMSKEELLQHIGTINPDVLLMAGAGDIELLVEPVSQCLNALGAKA